MHVLRPPRTRLTLTISAILAATFAVGCSHKASGETCTDLAPLGCPDAGPASYDAEVAAIVQQYCVTCHNPTGTNRTLLLGEYDGAHGLKANYLEAEGQLASCLMPNTGGTPIPDAEKVTLLTWLVCGAPDN